MDCINIVGLKFNMLTVISHEGRHPHRRGVSLWKCLCDCGNYKVVGRPELTKGETFSCGCYKKPIIKKKKHGLVNNRIYRVWADIKTRCLNANAQNFKNYGGRGIKICKEWEHDFQKFYNWAIEAGYEKGLQIDRIDNDGDYEPSNCRWATRLQNVNNRRRTILIEIDGVTKTTREWGEITGIPYKCIINRHTRGLRGKEAVYGAKKTNKNT